MIGTLGDIVFMATAETIRTFQDFNRSSSARWGKHDVHMLKPVSEFMGPDLDTISFKIRFDAAYGMNPRKEMDALLILNREGEAMDLTLGGKGVGVNLWVITSLKQSWDKVDNEGNVLVGTADVSLQEYV